MLAFKETSKAIDRCNKKYVFSLREFPVLVIAVGMWSLPYPDLSTLSQLVQSSQYLKEGYGVDPRTEL